MRRSAAVEALLACGLMLASMKVSALDLTVDSGAANDCSGRPQVRAAATGYLEPAPLSTVNEYGGDHYLPSPGNNIGVGVAMAEISAAAPYVCVGLLYRAEFEGAASKDLLDILHDNYFGQPFNAGRTYHAWYHAQSLKAEGIRLRHAFELPVSEGLNVTFGLGASLLNALQGRQQFLSGAVTATSSSYAVGTATWLRIESDLNPNDFNPLVGAGNPTGLGFTTDLELKVASAVGATLDAIVMDVGGRIYWRGTRDSLLMADNATIRYDANFNREALVYGVDSRINEVQHIPVKYHIAFSQLVVSQLSAVLEDDAVSGYHFASLGARYGSAQRNATALYDTRTHALGLGVHWYNFYASFTSNRWRPQDATALGASLGFAFHW